MLRGKVSPHEVTKDSIRYLSFYSLDLASIIQVTVAIAIDLLESIDVYLCCKVVDS